MSISKKYESKNTKELIGRIEFHEQMKLASSENASSINSDNRKVLIIHTGGTIGMFKNESGKYQPAKNRFQQFLDSYPYFSDSNETYFIGQDGFTITPQTIFKKKIWYKFIQLQKLIDSTNMNIQRINIILSIIQKYYANFDAFIILHGTDTMSFTASSLSFMIQNLTKTIILTGSQIPMSEMRNDATNNLLCSLIIAGHYHIPEVLVVFDNTIMRGNRTTKTSSSSFTSYTSPNFYPIGSLGLKIQMKWELIRICKVDKPTIFKRLKTEVGLLKLTPFGIMTNLNAKYLVIQSYGTGNVPTQGPFYQWLLENNKKKEEEKTIIVNISQVYQSRILNIYATGDMAQKMGLIAGSDMTCEAAVSKLSFLASMDLNFKEIKQLMSKNLRGQLTQEEDRLSAKKQNYVVNCSTVLQKQFANYSESYKELLIYNVIPKLLSQRSSQAAFEQLQQNGLNIQYIFPDGGTLLHHYFKEKNIQNDQFNFLKFLLTKGINVNVKDKDGTTALFYALQNGHIDQARIIHESPYNARVSVSSRRFFRAIRNNQTKLLQEMLLFDDEFLYLNEQNRNCLAFCSIINNKEIYTFFLQTINLQNTFYLNNRDIYQKSSSFYIQNKNWPKISEKDTDSLIDDLQSENGNNIMINVIPENQIQQYQQ